MMLAKWKPSLYYPFSKCGVNVTEDWQTAESQFIKRQLSNLEMNVGEKVKEETANLEIRMEQKVKAETAKLRRVVSNGTAVTTKNIKNELDNIRREFRQEISQVQGDPC